jgi:hypothetical protein
VSELVVKLICTDRNTHPSRALALLGRIPQRREDGTVVKETMDDPSSYTYQSLGSLVRDTKAGGKRGFHVPPTEIVTRADGGLTFILPGCPTCHRQLRLRDDTLGKLLRGLGDTPHGPVDVSLLPM